MSDDSQSVALAERIRAIRQRYVEEGLAPSYYEINNGLCDEFAREVADSEGLTGICEVSNGNFNRDGNDFSSRWDWTLLGKHWATSVPSGLTEAEMEQLVFGAHVWLTVDGRHFDAECPEGVTSLFDLPIFRRVVVRALRRKGIKTEDVLTDDIVVPPRCFVPNPD